MGKVLFVDYVMDKSYRAAPRFFRLRFRQGDVIRKVGILFSKPTEFFKETNLPRIAGPVPQTDRAAELFIGKLVQNDRSKRRNAHAAAYQDHLLMFHFIGYQAIITGRGNSIHGVHIPRSGPDS